MASCVICAAADEDEQPITHLANDVIPYFLSNTNCKLGSFTKF